MDHDRYPDGTIAAILADVSTIALVGASNNPARPSHGVMAFLLAKGYVVTPVNPGLEGQEIHGCLVYASLDDIPGPVDMVDVFRNSDAVPEVVEDAIRVKDKLGLSVIWMQLGVRHDAAAMAAEAAGLKVVMNRCPVIEYRRLHSGR